MLHIYFGEMDNVLHNVDVYFNNRFKYEWLEDELVKEMVLDVDKSVVESPECIKSPVLRQIPPTKLSGGVKSLIMMKYLPDRILNASSCGNNCAKWILRLAEDMELTINLNHIMEFSDETFQIEILNSGEVVTNMKELVESAVEYI